MLFSPHAFLFKMLFICRFTSLVQSLEFYEGVIKQTDASSTLIRQQLSEATAENLELQRLIMNQDVHKHETDTKLRIMEVGPFVPVDQLVLCTHSGSMRIQARFSFFHRHFLFPHIAVIRQTVPWQKSTAPLPRA